MSSEWTYVFTRPAERELRRIPSDDQRRIVRALRRMVDDPFAGDVRKLSGASNDFRLRVGQWRIRFWLDRDARTVVVESVRRRPDAYRD